MVMVMIYELCNLITQITRVGAGQLEGQFLGRSLQVRTSQSSLKHEPNLS
jgi:hypothetical protein